MNSSGIKRGLAVSAVAAMAAVGLPLSANATTVVDQFDADFSGPAVTLYSQALTSVVTTRNDGSNTTVRLQAGATSDISSVRFEYSADGGATWNFIGAPGRNDSGTFSLEWAPPATLVNSVTAQVRAIGEVGNSTVDDAKPILVQDANGLSSAVSITDADELGVYRSRINGEASVIVSGTATANSLPGVSRLDTEGDPVSLPAGAVKTGAPSTGIDSWSALVDINPYQFDTVDQAVFNATNGSDDTEAVTLYRQVLTKVDAKVGSLPSTPSQTSDVTVTVTDQRGKPVGGAFVINSLGTQAQITDARGQATFSQSVNNGNVQYIAKEINTSKAYQPELGDKQTADVLVGLAQASKLVAASADGAAFDRDEFANGDLTIEVQDQGGDPFTATGQTLSFNWVITPFDGSAAITTPTQTITDPATESIALPSSKSGTYDLFASLSDSGTNNPIAKSKIGSYKVGEAAVTFSQGPISAAPGTTVDIAGKLLLEDGTPLAGRTIDLAYAQGDEFDAQGGQTVADAALASPTAVKTGADGGFTAKVRDFAETPPRVEVGGVLTATSASTGAVETQRVDFTTDAAPADAKVTVDPSSTTGKAGRAVSSTITVTSATGTPLPGVTVALSLDHGQFVAGAKAPAAGAFDPTPNAIGATITRTTDTKGEITVDSTVLRDAGFDDDGLQKATLTAKAGTVSGTSTVEFSSRDAENLSSVALVPTSSPTGPVRLSESVSYEVVAKDQFGNRTSTTGDSVEIQNVTTDNVVDTTDADFDDTDGDVALDSNKAGTVVFRAVVPDGADKFDAKLVSQSIDVTSEPVSIEFYAAQPTTFTISGPTGSLQPGDAATVTVKVVDQKGNPVSGLEVQFVRDGDPSQRSIFTGPSGEATYVFNRTTEGTEKVTAVVRDNSQTVLKQLSTTIVYKAEAPAQQPVSARVIGYSKGSLDVIAINAQSDAAGAVVNVYKVVGGKLVRQKAGKLNASGDTTVSVADTNGSSRLTGYKVIVSPTSKTLKFTSAQINVK